LGEELVDDSICHAGRVVAALRGDGVEFVEEEDAGSGGFGSFEEISHALFGGPDVFV
jgi:hypothetical protein